MIPFVKMQAIGNDFIVVDASATQAYPQLAQRACHRRFGIGADGLLTFAPQEEGLVFRIFNADGSEDTMCGNGLRCVVRWAVDNRLVPAEGIAQTLSGPIAYSALAEQVSLTLPAPHFWPESLPHCQTVNTGSLHTVLWPDTLPDDPLFVRESAALEVHPLFPDRTSLMWTRVIGPNQLELRIWERGVGETLGCGTGACAAAVVAIDTGRCLPFEPVQVRSKGGELLVTWSGQASAPIELTGPAKVAFTGQLA